jgi:CRP-like cAMP-binding protein
VTSQTTFADLTELHPNGGRTVDSIYKRLAPNQTLKPNSHRFLESINIFSKLSSDELQQLADSSRFTTFAPGEYLTMEGDEDSQRGYIVVSGRLAILKSSGGGKELIVELLGPGEILGLVVALSHEHLSCELSTRAQSTTQVLWIPMRNFIALLDKHPVLYRECVAHLLHSLQTSYRLSCGLAHDRVEVRIAAILLSLDGKFSRTLPSGQNHTIDITRSQIADLTGTTPESAIRVTRAMQRSGFIDISRPGVIRVVNAKALQAITDGV